MISEHQFSTHYSSSWHSVAPLSDGFWAIENKRVDRIEAPLPPIAPKGMRAIINEAAFRAFCNVHPIARPIKRSQIVDAVSGSFQDAIDYVARFSNAPQVLLSDIDDPCQREAVALVDRLASHFPENSTAKLRPHFSGCGIISACEGDLIVNGCLYEVKAGDRPFRLLDLKQLLTYAALAYADDALNFTHLGLFNPRTGVTWRRSLDEVCRSISGLRPSDTLSALVEQFSVASVSR